MLEVPLSQGKIALIDNADLSLIEGHSWCTQKTRHHWYAITYVGSGHASRRRLTMHRLLMQSPKGFMIDHIDGNGLNNQRSNLRLATAAQNQSNKRIVSGASRFKGVFSEKRGRPWRAKIKVDGRQFSLGKFDHEADAARAYDRAALEHFGEFACTNAMLGLYDTH